MNKNNLVASVAEGADLSKADAAKAVDAVFDSITGEAIQIPASKQPKFKAGKGLKDAVN